MSRGSDREQSTPAGPRGSGVPQAGLGLDTGPEARVRFLGEMLDAVRQAVIATDLEGRILYCNASVEEIYGWPPGELVGQNVLTVMPADPQQGLAAEIMESVLRGESWTGEFEVRRRDGTLVVAEVTDTPIRDAEGTIVGVVGVSSDVSPRKRLERRLEVERRHLRQAFDRAPALMALLRGPDLVFEMANPMYERVVGRRVTGLPIREALPEVEGQGYFELLERVYQTGEPHVGRESRLELKRKGEDETAEVFFNFVYEPLPEPDGTISAVLVHAVDVTEQVRARREMEGLYHQVRAANEAKADFLAIISHELRTPLTAVLGYTDILEAEIGGPLTDRQRQQVGRIRESGRHLLDLIEEILAYARADAGAEEVRPQRISPTALTRECVSMVEVRARDRGLALRMSLPSEDVRIYTDPRLLRQILLNLLSNAVKFTDEGSVRVEVDVDDVWATFRVIDTGVGIPQDQLERIFEPFQQTQAVLTRSSPGTGLGLAVVRKLAGLLDGGVTVESAAGRGSTFTVRVPARQEGPGAGE